MKYILLCLGAAYSCCHSMDRSHIHIDSRKGCALTALTPKNHYTSAKPHTPRYRTARAIMKTELIRGELQQRQRLTSVEATERNELLLAALHDMRRRYHRRTSQVISYRRTLMCRQCGAERDRRGRFMAEDDWW